MHDMFEFIISDLATSTSTLAYLSYWRLLPQLGQKRHAALETELPQPGQAEEIG